MPPSAARPAEKVTFERARSVMHQRSELRGYTLAFAIAGVFVLFFAIQRLAMGVAGIWFIALACLIVAVYSQYQLTQLKRKEPGA
jgi:hypothetical protein